MPPMVIFKCGKIERAWREAAPSGYAIGCSKTGYINQELFAECGENFVHFLKDKELLGNGQKVLLLLDSHKSHLFNFHFMRYMQANGVEVCCFPPHCTHIIQPLDDTPFRNFKKIYQKELSEWNLKHLGSRMSRTDFFRVFVPSFTQAMSPACLNKGFENTGIYPVNPKVNKLARLGPSIVSDRYSKCRLLYWMLDWMYWSCSSSFSVTCSERDYRSKTTISLRIKRDFLKYSNKFTYMQVTMRSLLVMSQMMMLNRTELMRPLVVILWKYKKRLKFMQVRRNRMMKKMMEMMRLMRRMMTRMMRRTMRRTMRRRRRIPSGKKWSIRQQTEDLG